MLTAHDIDAMEQWLSSAEDSMEALKISCNEKLNIEACNRLSLLSNLRCRVRKIITDWHVRNEAAR